LLCRGFLVWCSPIYSFFLLDAKPSELCLGSYSLYLKTFHAHRLVESTLWKWPYYQN
jgi:hypothetical protein